MSWFRRRRMFIRKKGTFGGGGGGGGTAEADFSAASNSMYLPLLMEDI